MKRYEVYKNIRKQAMIIGLPISLFALMMTFVISSLLFVIFSFSLLVIIGAFVCNVTLYFALIKVAANPMVLNLKRVFPDLISNKKASQLNYEED